MREATMRLRVAEDQVVDVEDRYREALALAQGDHNDPHVRSAGAVVLAAHAEYQMAFSEWLKEEGA